MAKKKYRNNKCYAQDFISYKFEIYILKNIYIFGFRIGAFNPNISFPIM